MAAYLEKAKELMGTFPAASIEVILQSKNANVDALAKLASTKDVELLDAVVMEFLAEPSIRRYPKIMELTQEPSWMDPIIAYLRNGELPKGKTKAHILKLKATCYVLYDYKFYRRGYSMPLLKCIPPSKVEYIMREIHEGICGNHTKGQSLAFNSLRQGYYWLTMKGDCMEFT